MEQYDREYMKMAMLKHERTFREQVNELHRLYRVQKMLMRDMRRNALKAQEAGCEHQNNGGGLGRWDAVNKTVLNQPCHRRRRQERRRRALDLERPAEEYMEDDCKDTTLQDEEESEIELTLATGSHRRKKGETSYTSESGASFSSSSTESGGENLKLQEWGLFQFADTNRSFPAAKKSERESEFNVETMRQQDRLKQPPWLFQCLSLNMT
uniref:V-type sodium ATPase catalytic subunit A n=1 Tax=Anthurium amnicola TaxID=1678845 RepID=A0A1D1Z9I2_9ARAE